MASKKYGVGTGERAKHLREPEAFWKKTRRTAKVDIGEMTGYEEVAAEEDYESRHGGTDIVEDEDFNLDDEAKYQTEAAMLYDGTPESGSVRT